MLFVTIAETQPVFAEGLQRMLSQISDLHLKRLITSYQELISILNTEKTDLLLLDSELNTSITEVSMISQLKRNYPLLKITLFGRLEKFNTLSKLRKLGLEAYLSKDISCEELSKAICSVLAGKGYLQESISKALNCFENLQMSSIRPTKGKLTNREIEVLALIVEEFTNQEISEKLYISIPTVETHRKSLIVKMGVKNTAGLVRESIYRGWYREGYHGKP